jgi:hypothetical protein
LGFVLGAFQGTATGGPAEGSSNVISRRDYFSSIPNSIYRTQAFSSMLHLLKNIFKIIFRGWVQA